MANYTASTEIGVTTGADFTGERSRRYTETNTETGVSGANNFRTIGDDSATIIDGDFTLEASNATIETPVMVFRNGASSTFENCKITVTIGSGGGNNDRNVFNQNAPDSNTAFVEDTAVHEWTNVEYIFSNTSYGIAGATHPLGGQRGNYTLTFNNVTIRTLKSDVTFDDGFLFLTSLRSGSSFNNVSFDNFTVNTINGFAQLGTSWSGARGNYAVRILEDSNFIPTATSLTASTDRETGNQWTPFINNDFRNITVAATTDDFVSSINLNPNINLWVINGEFGGEFAPITQFVSAGNFTFSGFQFAYVTNAVTWSPNHVNNLGISLSDGRYLFSEDDASGARAYENPGTFGPTDQPDAFSNGTLVPANGFIIATETYESNATNSLPGNNPAAVGDNNLTDPDLSVISVDVYSYYNEIKVGEPLTASVATIDGSNLNISTQQDIAAADESAYLNSTDAGDSELIAAVVTADNIYPALKSWSVNDGAATVTGRDFLTAAANTSGSTLDFGAGSLTLTGGATDVRSITGRADAATAVVVWNGATLSGGDIIDTLETGTSLTVTATTVYSNLTFIAETISLGGVDFGAGVTLNASTTIAGLAPNNIASGEQVVIENGRTGVTNINVTLFNGTNDFTFEDALSLSESTGGSTVTLSASAGQDITVFTNDTRVLGSANVTVQAPLISFSVGSQFGTDAELQAAGGYAVVVNTASTNITLPAATTAFPTTAIAADTGVVVEVTGTTTLADVTYTRPNTDTATYRMYYIRDQIDLGTADIDLYDFGSADLTPSTATGDSVVFDRQYPNSVVSGLTIDVDANIDDGTVTAGVVEYLVTGFDATAATPAQTGSLGAYILASENYIRGVAINELTNADNLITFGVSVSGTPTVTFNTASDVIRLSNATVQQQLSGATGFTTDQLGAVASVISLSINLVIGTADQIEAAASNPALEQGVSYIVNIAQDNPIINAPSGVGVYDPNGDYTNL